MEALFLIPARRCDLVELAGIPVVAWAIRNARKAARSFVDSRVVVWTDDDQVSAVCRAWGAEVHVARATGDGGVGEALASLARDSAHSWAPSLACVVMPRRPLTSPGDVVASVKRSQQSHSAAAGLPILDLRERIDESSEVAHWEAESAARAVQPVQIGDRAIGANYTPFVIAEAGVNHNGSVELAHRLVDAAADLGVDAVKFQTFDPEQLASRNAPLAPYQQRNVDSPNQLAMLASVALSPAAHAELQRHALERKLLFLSSPFDERSADLLDSMNVPAFKIPSGELTNTPFLAYVARKGRPMLVSTGMSSMIEVAAAVDAIEESGAPPIVLFHCVSSYPAAPEDANLRAMATLTAAFGVPVGWSDHTIGAEAALAAIALGATCIERHLTLDRSLPGPDHSASLTPVDFARMLSSLPIVAAARGDGRKVPRDAEREVAAVARKSLHWVEGGRAGARVEARMIRAQRPAAGLAPSLRAEVLSRVLARDVVAGDPVMAHDLEPPT